jgi:hypothetical protein
LDCDVAYDVTTVAEQAKRYPAFAEYAEKTRRVIPVVELVPVGS